MNQKKIWIIIILMTTALLGSIFIQSYWIKLAVEENEETFDNNVQSALIKVADGLKMDDEYKLMVNDKYTSASPLTSLIDNSKDGTKLNLKLKNPSILDSISKDIEPNFSAGISRKLQQSFEKEYITRQLDGIPIAERVNPRSLKSYIELAMKDIRINTHYDYGVWSNRKNSFVIFRDMFVFEETEAGMSQATVVNASLQDSKYEVNLFPSQYTSSPGKLKVYFPNRTRIVWAGIVPMVVASVVFTGLILMCFFYTIYVIFTQKKISEIKTDFINNMTHEFKTPIATISLASDSILNPKILGQDEKVKKFANLIKEENKRMLSQVEKVLQIAQIDKKDLQLKWTQVNIHDIIKQAVEHINLQLQAKEGNASTELLAKEPIIDGDLTHLSNIIHNLLDNANKYTPEKPIIKVITRDKKDGIEIIVQDNGIGINKEDRKQVFEKFYRVPTGNRHDVKGFGLGLSYVKAMVTAHYGQVEVRSELGKGSSFILYLPKKHVA